MRKNNFKTLGLLFIMVLLVFGFSSCGGFKGKLIKIEVKNKGELYAITGSLRQTFTEIDEVAGIPKGCTVADLKYMYRPFFEKKLFLIGKQK